MPNTGGLGTPPGAAIVRLIGAGSAWLERLPGVPRPHILTVTITEPSQRDVASTLLEERGYRIAGQVRADAAHIDVLVPIAIAQSERDFFVALLAVGDKAFDLRLGPVQRLLGPAIAGHRLG